MKKIILIRHAESEANERKVVPTATHNIKLTKKGKQQARTLAEKLDKPDRLIVSKFIRTIETVDPLMKKYPDMEIYLWPEIHEFEHIDFGHESINFKNFDEVLVHDEKYWDRLDPFHKMSDEVETFAEFVDRAVKALGKMKSLDGMNYVISHGWFLKLLLVLSQHFNDFDNLKNDKDIYKKIMGKFIVMEKEFKTENTGQYDVTELVENFRSKKHFDILSL